MKHALIAKASPNEIHNRTHRGSSSVSYIWLSAPIVARTEPETSQIVRAIPKTMSPALACDRIRSAA